MDKKGIEEYREEIYLFDEMSKSVKVKTTNSRKIKRKYEISSIDYVTLPWHK